MKIEIEKGSLIEVINYFYGLKLARKQSRFRRHLIEHLKSKAEVYEEDRKELLEEHSEKDSEGKAVIKDGQYQVKNVEAYGEDLKELNKEKITIEGGDNREMIRTITEVLRKFEDVEYEGKDSEVYDYLCEQFQVDEIENEQEGKQGNSKK